VHIFFSDDYKTKHISRSLPIKSCSNLFPSNVACKSCERSEVYQPSNRSLQVSNLLSAQFSPQLSCSLNCPDWCHQTRLRQLTVEARETPSVTHPSSCTAPIMFGLLSLSIEITRFKAPNGRRE